MRILGIDPGLGRIGWGVIEYTPTLTTALAYGCITSSQKEELGQRLCEIEKDVTALVRKWRPDTAALEKIFFSKNVTTAFSVGHARGVILLVLAKAHIPSVAFSPPEIKRTVAGYGNANKRQIQEMVKRLLSLDEIPQPDDTADALAIALCAAVPLIFQK